MKYTDAVKVVNFHDGEEILDRFLKISNKLNKNLIDKINTYIKGLSNDEYIGLCMNISAKYKESLEWFYEGEFLKLIKEDACVAAIYEYLQEKEK